MAYKCHGYAGNPCGKFTNTEGHLCESCKEKNKKRNTANNPISNPVRNSGIYKEQYNFRVKHGGTLPEAKAAWKAKTGKEWLTPSALQTVATPVWNPSINYEGLAPTQTIRVKNPTTKREQRENRSVKNSYLTFLRTTETVPVGFTNNDADVIWEKDGVLYLAETKYSVGNIHHAVGQILWYAHHARKAMTLGQREELPIVPQVVFNEQPSEIAVDYANSHGVQVVVIGGK